MDEVLKAYVAAMIDGEGVITLARSSGVLVPRFRPIVMVTNSHAGILHFLCEATKLGIVYQSKNNPTKPNWSPMHRWQVATAEAQDLCHWIRPYLVIKRQQADILIKFPKRKTRRRKGDKDKIWLVQQELFLEMRTLNTRGHTGVKVTTFPDDHPLLPINRRRQER